MSVRVKSVKVMSELEFKGVPVIGNDGGGGEGGE